MNNNHYLKTFIKNRFGNTRYTAYYTEDGRSALLTTNNTDIFAVHQENGHTPVVQVLQNYEWVDIEEGEKLPL